MWFLLIACKGGSIDVPDTDGTLDSDSDSVETDGEAADYRLPGPFSVTTTSGTTATSCDMAWDRFDPEAPATDVVVVLSHGFARDKGKMAGHAAQIASYGVSVVTPALCHASPFDTDHEQNGADLVALAADLGADRVIYAGHSAGALASILATAADPHAVAMFGLDGVDSGSIGQEAARATTVPIAGLAGEPSDCNSTNNGLTWYLAAPDGSAFRAVEADHCDFENPTDSLCGLLCPGTNEQVDDATIRATIDGMATAFVVWRSGADPRGEPWWNGSQAQEFVDAGVLREP